MVRSDRRMEAAPAPWRGQGCVFHSEPLTFNLLVMRIATWNINGLRARLDFVLHWLRSREPDIVGLQELKVTEDQFPFDAFESEGYSVVVEAQKAWNGVAILSRRTPGPVQKGLPGEEALGARLVEAQIGDLTFITVYCPNGKHVGHPDFPRKLTWFESLGRYLANRHTSKQPLILCGDLNLCPAPIDSWNEEGLEGRIFHTREERERFQNLRKWGLVDLFRELYPLEQKFSWWDYRAGSFHRNQGLRIDFLLATTPVLGRLQEVTIDRDYRKKQEGMIASDHAPVFADLEW